MQKVVVICRVRSVKRLFNRSRTLSNDRAGESVFIFNNSQIKYLKNKTTYLNGKTHLEGRNCFSHFRCLNLSYTTYRNFMSVANNYMIESEHRLFVGPAYSYNRKISDFQTVVTGTIEENEYDRPIECAYREIDEEIGIDPVDIKILDTSFYGDLKVFTLVADF